MNDIKTYDECIIAGMRAKLERAEAERDALEREVWLKRAVTFRLEKRLIFAAADHVGAGEGVAQQLQSDDARDQQKVLDQLQAHRQGSAERSFCLGRMMPTALIWSIWQL